MNQDARARLLGHLASLSRPLHFSEADDSALASHVAPPLAPRGRMSGAEKLLSLIDVANLFPQSAIARMIDDARRNVTHPSIRALIQFQNRTKK